MAKVADRAPVADWATDFDHFDPGFVADPYPVYDRLRDAHPVARSERFGGMAVLTRWADIAEVAHDTGRFSSRRVIVNEVPTSHPGLPLPPLNYDPPVHTPLRRSVLPFFNPRATARWEAAIRDICDRQLARLEGRVECDAAVEFAQAIPSEITAIMLGVDPSEGDRFRAWIHDLVEVGPTDTTVLRRTTYEMTDYLGALVAGRRATLAAEDNATPAPDRAQRAESAVGDAGQDIVTFLVRDAAPEAGLTDRDIVNTLFLVLIAGIDTTWSAIGFALLHLATHPADRARLVAEPDLIPLATEEFLRAYAPVTMARVATEDTTVAGRPVRDGDWVMMAFPAANRDPEAFDRADEVVIDRARNRHATFGLGVHRCIGSNLARLEINLALEHWLARIPEFTLADASRVTYASGPVRGPRCIPLRLG